MVLRKGFYEFLFFSTFIFDIQVNGKSCEVGIHLDQFNEWKWVLPYPDPCTCTKVIMGGVNTWNFGHPFMRTYDSSLFSDDVNEFLDQLLLTCGELWLISLFKGFSWGGYGFADRFMILTYLCPTILQQTIYGRILPKFHPGSAFWVIFPKLNIFSSPQPQRFELPSLMGFAL